VHHDDTNHPVVGQANSLYECKNTHQLITFYHACLFSPIISTWVKAIQEGYFKGWPGLMAERVRRFISVVPATEKGHMDQVRQGLWSAKSKLSNIQYFALSDNDSDTNMPADPTTMNHVEQMPSNKRTHTVYMTMHDIHGKIYTNTSNQGHAYIVIFYVFDANYVRSIPIKNRSKEELLCAYKQTSRPHCTTIDVSK
jgi:hypothetical protein